MSEPAGPLVNAVHASDAHSFSKFAELSITLIEGIGVAGDVHAGLTVRHRSRVARDPFAVNLRQIHMLHVELFDELIEAGFAVFPGDLGENITTRGIDLLALPTGARLTIGRSAVVQVTGLRNPCSQLNRFQPGLMGATLGKEANGRVIRKTGVMAIVVAGGEVRPGDLIGIVLPAGVHKRLEPV